jgi:hypothetical protein
MPSPSALTLALCEEVLRRLEPVSADLGYFDRQQEVANDRSELKALLCGRRGGKTEFLARWLYEGLLLWPGENHVYVVLRKNQARRIMKRMLERLNRQLKLGLTFTEKDQQLFCVHPNGGTIWLTGCDDALEAEKFRGDRYGRVVIDEAGSFGQYLQMLVEESIEPALADLNGQLIVAGSPGLVPRGYFWAITTGDDSEIRQWPTYAWTCLDNPHIDASKFIATNEAGRPVPGPRLVERGWSAEHPTFRREWLGLWVKDLQEMAFPYDAILNHTDSAPEDGDWRHAIVVDLGASEERKSTAFGVFGTRTGMPELYVLETEKRAGMIPSGIAARVQMYRERYPRAQVIVDEGALGKGYANEMRERHGIPCEAAHKSEKLAYAEMTRGELLSGQLKIVGSRNRELVDEMYALTMADLADRVSWAHLCDVLLYGSRALRTVYRPEEVPPVPGSPEAVQAEIRAAKKAAEARVRKAQRDRLRRRYG